ncbi:MAG: nucleoside hydrolase [Clostridiales bacterium]|jgi:purine nucleosidase|nr:nucleoside hydrolase [Clostridiales bacterium]
MKKLIIDCDNTFGVTDCDLDDGLAIIYAAGTGRCQLLGVTTTFGNNVLEVVHPNTVEFMKNIGLGDIPVRKGHEDNPEENEAARFLLETADRYPGEVSVLAVGSLTNLYHAWRLDSKFFEKIQGLSLMGGVTEPLIICGKQLDELNFSCNSAAALHVLSHGQNIRIATGNLCLDALFTKERFDRLAQSKSPFLRWLQAQGQYWFARENEVFGHNGIYKWDVYAAAALLHPEFFHENTVSISPDAQSMKTGMLLGQGQPKAATLPILKDSRAYIEHVYTAYANFASRR